MITVAFPAMYDTSYCSLVYSLFRVRFVFTYFADGQPAGCRVLTQKPLKRFPQQRWLESGNLSSNHEAPTRDGAHPVGHFLPIPTLLCRVHDIHSLHRTKAARDKPLFVSRAPANRQLPKHIIACLSASPPLPPPRLP